MRVYDGIYGEVKRFCKDGTKIYKEKEMKVSMYACDGCKQPFKSKDEIENAVKVPTSVIEKKTGKEKMVKKVKHLCKKCNEALQDRIKSLFK